MFSEEIQNNIKQLKEKHKKYAEKEQNKRKLSQLKAKMHDLSGRSYYEDYRVFLKDERINKLISSYKIKGNESLFIVCNNEQVLRSFIAVYYRLTKKTHKKTYNTLTYNEDMLEREDPPEDTAVLVFNMGNYQSLSPKQKEWLSNNLIAKGEARKPLDMSTIIISTGMIETIKQSGVFQIINVSIGDLRKYGLNEDRAKIDVKLNETDNSDSFDAQGN